PSIRTIGLRVTDNYGNVSPVSTALLTITNVAPTVNPLVVAPGTAVNENTPVTVTASATDPSPADTTAGFTYAWTVTKNGLPFLGFTGQGTNAITINDSDAPATPDAIAVSVAVSDKDGGAGTGNTSFTVSNV